MLYPMLIAPWGDWAPYATISSTEERDHFMVRRFLIVCFALLAITGLTATPALAGGVGNFYYARSCGNGTLKANLTNYDINAMTDQRYHHSANLPSGWSYVGTYYDNNKWPYVGTSDIGHSGTSRDGYQDYGYMLGDHDVAFQWVNGTRYYTCFIYL